MNIFKFSFPHQILAGLTNAPETVTLTLDGTCSCLPPPQIDLFLCLPIMLSVDWLASPTKLDEAVQFLRQSSRGQPPSVCQQRDQAD